MSRCFGRGGLYKNINKYIVVVSAPMVSWVDVLITLLKAGSLAGGTLPTITAVILKLLKCKTRLIGGRIQKDDDIPLHRLFDI